MNVHPPPGSLRASGLIALAIGLAAFHPSFADAYSKDAGRKKPNVLLLMCDQLTAGALGCYGGSISTPNIDRIAREGVRFTQAVCPTPFCSPTRASIITGMYPHAHGIVTNCRHDAGQGQEGINNRDVTTDRLLSEAGYATHHFGKWHLTGERLSYYPSMYRPGFEYAEEMEQVFARVRTTDPSGWMDWYNWALPVEVAPPLRKAAASLGDAWKGQRFAEFIIDMGRLKLPLDQVYDIRVADRAVDTLAELAGKQAPFMLTCSFNAPHDPNVVPSPYYEAFDPQKMELPENRDTREARYERQWSRRIVADLGEPGLREFLRVYCGMVKMVDDQVGRILKTLDERGMTDDTVILFTADHGDMMGGHGMVWKSTSAFYDEIVLVPLLIRYPAAIEPQVSRLAVDLTDVMPTLLDLLGRPAPEQVQGQSLVPYLTGRRDPGAARPFCFSERVDRHPEGDRRVVRGTKGDFMIRGQGWKYIRYRQGEDYLYHLTDDPGETRNLAGDARYGPWKKKLSSELDAWLRRTGWPG
jgi:arylsulfatase A-like enzyme